jgi:7,8-dihydropterin-6-yl-methyl-4-(beta-D-ribofuranosyl)aminobenzene 5'-phosphate synthase
MVRITVLCDNAVQLSPRGGIGEHGFAALVEMEREKILFDTGSGKGIVSNSLTFEKDLRGVKRILLSHGHADHTGGLSQVLSLTGAAEVWGHPGIFSERISVTGRGQDAVRRSAGIPHSREYFELMGAEFHLQRGFHEMGDGVFLTGEVPRRTPFEQNDPRLFAKSGKEYVPDVIPDDQSLVIKMARGLVVVFGCAHSGMINTLNHARHQTGEERLLGLLGGTHLGFLTDTQLEASIQELKAMDPNMVAVSHCTGMKSAARLMQSFGERFDFANVGKTFEFE